MSNELPAAQVGSAMGANRRQLLARAGLVGAAAIGASLMPKGLSNQAQGAQVGVYRGTGRPFRINNYDIFNFALNLEYLEAEFYQRTVFGTGLPDGDITGTGTAGAVTGGSQVTFTDPIVQSIAQDIATDELNHVRAIRATIGAQAVARPAIDLQSSFTAAAVAANIIPAGQTFDPYANQTNFLLAAFIFEDVGVTAYHGATPFINNDAYLSAAAGILAVEAYHAGAIRTLLLSLNDDTVTTDANKIALLRETASAAADGVAPTDAGLSGVDGIRILAAADSNSIAFARSFAAVLNIVYLTQQPGGFFPNGLNGRIK